MKALNLKSWFPHIGALLLFVLLAYGYMPGLLQGRGLNQSDDTAWKAIYQESKEYKESTGEDALWTNSIFGGMPTTTITLSQKDNLLAPIYNFLFQGVHPASDLVVGMLGFYLLMLVFGVNPWLAIIGAIGFAFCSYNMQIIEAGHNTKMAAIAFMPWVFAGLAYCFRRGALLGAVMFGIAMSFELFANHPQITFYLTIAMLFYGVVEMIAARKAKMLSKFFIKVAFIVVAGVLALGSNANRLLPTLDYAKYTMRGGSELTESSNNSATSDGLNLEYATEWSYGVDETLNLMIPNLKGGSSAGALGTDSETYKVLRNGGVQQVNSIVKALPLYWGDQIFTSGPMYMGAITIFLFVFAILMAAKATRWVLVVLSLLVMMLAWGRNFMPLTEFFHNFVPLYNKFRVPSMILVVFQLIMPFAAVLVVDRLLKGEVQFAKPVIVKRLLWATIATAGLSLLFALVPSLAGDFVSRHDAQYPGLMADALRIDRVALLRADALRSMLFILAAAAVILFTLKGKLKQRYSILALGLLILVDLWSVDKRYLSDSDFVAKRGSAQQFPMSRADKQILQDKELSYRVMDVTSSQFPNISNELISEMVSNAFNSSTSAYYHKLTGGYSAAKMQRYQDVIDRYLTQEIVNVVYGLNSADVINQEVLNAVVQGGKVMNMLNTKYFIFNPNTIAVNNSAMGNAWFVENVAVAATPDAEIDAIADIEPLNDVVVGNDFADQLGSKHYAKDSADYINMTVYSPNRLEYEYSAANDALALFSEVYYPGWVAEVDGQKINLIRANYIMRAAELPKGKHTLVMSFEPEAYKKGGVMAVISSALLLFMFAGFLIMTLFKRKE